METERLITVQELASFFGISLRTMNSHIANGDAPPSIRIGRFRRWRFSDVLAWLDGQQACATSQPQINKRGR